MELVPIEYVVTCPWNRSRRHLFFLAELRQSTAGRSSQEEVLAAFLSRRQFHDLGLPKSWGYSLKSSSHEWPWLGNRKPWFRDWEVPYLYIENYWGITNRKWWYHENVMELWDLWIGVAGNSPDEELLRLVNMKICQSWWKLIHISAVCWRI